MTVLRIMAIVCLALFVSACDQVRTVAATQVLVTVSSELGSELASVEAQVFDAAEQTPGRKQVFTKTPPFSFAIVPAPRSPVTKILVVITAKDAGDAVLAVSKAVISFVPTKRITLDLRFALACRDQTCSPGQTCLVSSAGSAECGQTPVTGGREMDPGSEPGSELIDIIMGTGDGGPGTPGGTSEAGMDGADTGSEGMGGTPGGNGDGGTPEASVSAPECEATNPCAAGYQCKGGKCVSLCEQTSCDPNATCSLMAGAPVCTCGSGYVARRETNGATTCLKDVQCVELGCHTNASCEVGTDQVRHCVCNPGYMGAGTTCAPISCGTLSVLNGTVNTNGGTFGQTATYTCDTGYAKTGGTTRKCEVGGWSGSASTCEAFDCMLPSAPAHGSVAATNGTRFPNGMVRYTCATGYRLTGTNSDTRTCTATGWSGANPTCLGCGDGIVSAELNEECEVSASTNAWTCIGCKRTNPSYAPCPASAICAGGLDCHSGGYCTVAACTSDAQCLPTPPGPVTAFCQVGFACTLRGCTANAQCPPGLRCDTASSFCVL